MPEREQFGAGGEPPRNTRCSGHGDSAISVAQTKEPSNRHPGVPGRNWPCASADAMERTMTDSQRRQGPGLSHSQVPDIASHTPEALSHNHPQMGATSIRICCENQVLEELDCSFFKVPTAKDPSTSEISSLLVTMRATGSPRTSSPRASMVRLVRRRFRQIASRPCRIRRQRRQTRGRN